MERKCKICNAIIPAGRLKALPNTRTCVEHSNEERYYVNSIVKSDEDYFEIELIKDPKVIAQLEAAKKSIGKHGLSN